MKTSIRVLTVLFALAMMLSAIPAFAEGTVTVDMESILLQAEDILSRPFKDSRKIDRDNALPPDMQITGPFLFVGFTDFDLQAFVPDGMSDEYVPSGLPEGTKIHVTENSDIAKQYPDLIRRDADAPVVYALLFSTGYSNEAHYQNDLTVYHRDFVIVFVDYASGEILAWTEGMEQEEAPFMLYGSDYTTDLNGRKVFNPDNISYIGNTWRNTLLYAAADDVGAAILNGVLVSINNKDIEEYTVPDGVTEIGDRAFEGCDRLKSVILSPSVETIGWYSFAGCTLLEHVELSEGLDRISVGAFQGCESLEGIVLPEWLYDIGDNAFQGCASLRDITFPPTLKALGEGALEGTAWLAQRESEPFAITDTGLLVKVNPTGEYDASEELMSAIEEYGDPSEWSYEDRLFLTGELGLSFTVPVDEMVIPDGVRYLAYGCLSNVSIGRLVLPGTLAEFWAYPNVLLNVAVEEIYVSDGVSDLPGGIFNGCVGLRRVRLPADISGVMNMLDEGKGNVVVICSEGSKTYTVAQNSGYQVEAEK